MRIHFSILRLLVFLFFTSLCVASPRHFIAGSESLGGVIKSPLVLLHFDGDSLNFNSVIVPKGVAVDFISLAPGESGFYAGFSPMPGRYKIICIKSGFTYKTDVFDFEICRSCFFYKVYHSDEKYLVLDFLDGNSKSNYIHVNVDKKEIEVIDYTFKKGVVNFGVSGGLSSTQGYFSEIQENDEGKLYVSSPKDTMLLSWERPNYEIQSRYFS